MGFFAALHEMKRSPITRTGFKSRTRTVRRRRAALRPKPESSEAKKFKRAVRERDDYTCQRCFKVRDKHIHVHHIAPRSRRPDLKLIVSNGICLDWECHSWVHSHPVEAVALGLLSTDSYEKALRAA